MWVGIAKKFYVFRSFKKFNGKYGITSLHHAIMGQPLNGLVVDHQNGNPLDNRRKNLRIVTFRQNMQNQRKRREGKTSSQYVGVFWDKIKNKWRAQISIKNHSFHIGYYYLEEDAKNAYQNAIKTLLK